MRRGGKSDTDTLQFFVSHYNNVERVRTMDYIIQKAEKKDLPVILEIYAYARSFMAATGNPNQWGKTNPPREILERDIDRGELYVLWGEGQIQGVFAFLLGEDPTYGYIEGSWKSTVPYGTIHRVASRGAGGVLAAAVAYCRQTISHLRIDTHHDNKIMQRAIAKAGFQRRGVIYLENGDPRIAYEMT